MTIPCCVPGFGCIDMEDVVECLAAGGWDNELECNDPDSLCTEISPEPEPEGCLGPETWPADSKGYYTLDLCEHTTAVPTFIDSDFEAVSIHKSRAQPVGHGQDPCQYNESILTINDDGEAEFMMCTGRAQQSIGYAMGVLFIEEGEASILFSTEAPFFVEANYFSTGNLCQPPVL